MNRTHRSLARACRALLLCAVACSQSTDAPFERAAASTHGTESRGPARTTSFRLTPVVAAGAPAMSSALSALRKRLDAIGLSARIEQRDGALRVELPATYTAEQAAHFWSRGQFLVAQLDSGDWLHSLDVTRVYGDRIRTTMTEDSGRYYRGLLLDAPPPDALRALAPKEVDLKLVPYIEGPLVVGILAANSLSARCLTVAVLQDEAEWLVRCSLKEQDALALGALTAAMVGKYVAVGSDPGPLHVAIVQDAIHGGVLSLPAPDELTAKLVAAALRHPLPFELTAERSVPPASQQRDH